MSDHPFVGGNPEPDDVEQDENLEMLWLRDLQDKARQEQADEQKGLGL